MIKTQEHLYKITASLLNSWAYIYECKPEYSEDAYDSFIKTLNRIKTPPNIYMQRGIDFEEKVYNGEVQTLSQICEGGAFQVYIEKEYNINDIPIKVLGYIDALKQGVVYDIKRVTSYDVGKYFWSRQHHVYMNLVPEADEFIYLIAAGYNDNNIDIHTEKYEKDDIIDLREIIKEFFLWLENNNLMETYLKNWLIEK